MARALRILFSGAIYHVTSRGNAKQDVYIDDNDRTLFLDILDKCVKRYGFIIHAFCLMDNHYHLLIETPDGNLSDGMRHINQVYTQKFNWRHNRVGHLFQGRFKAAMIEQDSHLLEVIRYVVNNPVRAGYVESPSDYHWSSYRQTAGMSRGFGWLTTSWVLEQFSGTKGQKQNQYAQFVNEDMEGKMKDEFAIGGKSFAQILSEYAWESDPIEAIPQKQRAVGRPPLKAIFGEVKDKHVRNERIVEAHIDFGYSEREIAWHLNMHRSSISRIVLAAN